ncbi:hypothetical protein DL96DRAFT_1720309 [Flagelloscypha sp. PMI_526]|nr:hypothetical protein DL96DRAFT_1720309 [Flagelloscypha sp. PMI_526]
MPMASPSSDMPGTPHSQTMSTESSLTLSTYSPKGTNEAFYNTLASMDDPLLDDTYFVIAIDDNVFMYPADSNIINNPRRAAKDAYPERIRVLRCPPESRIPVFYPDELLDADMPKVSSPQILRLIHLEMTFVVFAASQTGIFENVANLNKVRDTQTIWATYCNLRAAEQAWAYAQTNGWVTTGDPIEVGLAQSDRTHHLPKSCLEARNPMSSGHKSYAVYRGVRPGVYCSWVEAAFQVVGTTKGEYCSFDTFEAATKRFQEKLAEGNVQTLG